MESFFIFVACTAVCLVLRSPDIGNKLYLKITFPINLPVTYFTYLSDEFLNLHI